MNGWRVRLDSLAATRQGSVRANDVDVFCDAGSAKIRNGLMAVARRVRKLKKQSVIHLKWIFWLWMAQLVLIGWFFWNLTWSNYWFFRGFYRPGIRLIGHMGETVLAGSVFNPFDRTGVLICFMLATLVYAVVVVMAVTVMLRIVRR